MAALAAFPERLAAQDYAAQLVLHPPESDVAVKSARSAWRRAASHIFLRQGDSLRVASGSVELFYRSGARKTYTSGAALLVTRQPEDARASRPPALRAALETLMDLLPGGAGGGQERDRSLESGVRRAAGIVGSSRASRAANAPAEIAARFPNRPWLIGPETPMLRWNFFPHGPEWLKVQIYPAAATQGCPAVGLMVLDTVIVGYGLARPFAAARLQPDQAYRVEVGVSDIVRTGCIRTLPARQADHLAADMADLYTEFGTGALPPGQETTLRLLQAGLFVRHGLLLDALVLLEELIAAGGAVETARPLWNEIAARSGLDRVGPWP